MVIRSRYALQSPLCVLYSVLRCCAADVQDFERERCEMDENKLVITLYDSQDPEIQTMHALTEVMQRLENMRSHEFSDEYDDTVDRIVVWFSGRYTTQQS